jgi:hypothetical protein
MFLKAFEDHYRIRKTGDEKRSPPVRKDHRQITGKAFHPASTLHLPEPR